MPVMEATLVLKNPVFLDVAPCGCCVGQRFGGACRHHLQGRKSANKKPAQAGDCRLSHFQKHSYMRVGREGKWSTWEINREERGRRVCGDGPASGRPELD